MPRHKQVTTCRKSGGSLSKHCACEHCCLSVCEVCGGAEGSLTTDCPGTKVGHERQQEIYETTLDYTDARGWHVARNDDGSPNARRLPRFEDTKVPPEPPSADPRTLAAPTIDWGRVDRTLNLQHELMLKGVAWAIADRTCEDRSASLARIQEATEPLRGKTELDAKERDLLGTLEQEKISFQIACRNVERCKDESEQLARRILTTLEQDPVVVTATER